MLNLSLYQSEKDDWETPRNLFDMLDHEFHFTLDACATSRNAKCNRYYSRSENGLSQPWAGSVWMNPPYGRGIDQWVRKAYETVKPTIVVCLLPVRSDTRWWHDYVMKAAEIRLLTRRLSFEGANNKAPFPAAIVVFDGDQHKCPKLRALPI